MSKGHSSFDKSGKRVHYMSLTSPAQNTSYYLWVTNLNLVSALLDDFNHLSPSLITCLGLNSLMIFLLQIFYSTLKIKNLGGKIKEIQIIISISISLKLKLFHE